MKTLRWLLNRGRLITTATPLITADGPVIGRSATPGAPVTGGTSSHADANRLTRIATLLTADTDARLHRIAALLTTDIDA